MLNTNSYTQPISVEPSSSLDNLSVHSCDLIDGITAMAIDMLPQVKLAGRTQQVRAFVEEAYKYTDLDYNIDKAVIWGNNFVFPPEAFTRDAADLADLNYDLTALIRSRQLSLLPGRLNHARLEGRDVSHPDTSLLHDLVDGIRIPLEPDFIEDHLPPKPDRDYITAHCAVDKMWFELYQSGFALLIPTTVAQRIPMSIRRNYSPVGWKRKRDKAKGRSTSDYSRKNRFGKALNTDWVNALVKEFYGPIEPCRIEALVLMVLDQIDRVGLELIRLWKMDLRGAFNLLFIRAEDAGLLSMELSDGMTVIPIVGNFGSTVPPYAFNVISRTILSDFKSKAKGDAGICTDDLMGACSQTELDHDMTWARACIEGTCGDKSVAEDKTETSAEQLVFIGWSMDLKLQVLGIARHNVLKTFYGFCLARGQTHLSILELQRLASRACRYSLVCRYMKPFSCYIYNACVGYYRLQTQVPVTDNLRMVIDLWLMFLLVMELEPHKFNRPMASFREVPPKYMGNLDASLTGLSVIISRVSHQDANTRDQPEVLEPEDARVVAVAGYQLPYDLDGDSSYQNTVEFIGIVVVLCLLTSLGRGCGGIMVQGDSTTALSWSADEKFKVGRSSAAAIFYMQLQQRYETIISSTEHIAGAINPSDPLSRGVSPAALGYHASVSYDLRDNPTLVAIIASMDPTAAMDLMGDLTTRWRQNESWIDVLRSAGGGWNPQHDT